MMKVLFVSYSAISGNQGETSYIGVLKRCIRLIYHFDMSRFTVYLLNFGELPMDDPFVTQTLKMINVVNLPDQSNSSLEELLTRLSPEIVILGEGPGSGKMLELSEHACKLGIPQICIENYYRKEQPVYFKKESPWLDQWLLIGIPFTHQFGRIADNAVIVPPLIPSPENVGSGNSGVITILGYDPTVMSLGLKLASKLPGEIEIRLIYAAKLKSMLPGVKKRYPFLNIRYITMPTEKELSRYISESSFVVGKSGFQQIVECIALGTPIITYEAPGGVPEILLIEEFRDYAIYFPKDDQSWDKTLVKASFWLKSKPSIPWTEKFLTVGDPLKFGASEMQKLIRFVVDQ